MATVTRIYRVKTPTDSRLVRAPNQAQAIRHVAAGILSAEVATQDDLVTLVKAGVDIEQAGEKDDDQPEA
jgi:hypothetical protein